MKVEGTRPPENQEIQLRSQKVGNKEAGAGNSESSQKVSQSDQVRLSGRAKELAELKQVIQQMPEIRTEKVEALKKSIQDGTYTMDSFKIAGKILEEI